MGRKPFISLDGVTIRLYDRILFENTSWEILSDQHWVVVGPNGSGKSTLVKALCGQVPIVAGRVVYHFSENGAAGTGSGASTLPREHIAYVSFDAQKATLARQDAFHQARWNSSRSQDGIPVSDYLSEGHVHRINPFQVVEKHAGPVRRGAFAARRARVVDLLEIEPLLGRNSVQLSNGERRKLSIARALLRNPRLLILDNPFTGLDQGFRVRLREIVRRLTRDEMRVIIVTTDRDEIPAGITHVLRVADGQVVGQAPVQKPGFFPGMRDRPSLRESSKENPCPIASERNRVSQGRILVHMENVRVSYNSTPVLRGIDWTVRAGERWALLGPNGAGKTTLLSLILGDNPQAYANRITLFGRQRGSGESMWEIKRRIGWVAPELHLYYPFHATGFDVVCSGFHDSVGLYRRCSPRQRQQARAWMARLGVTDCADAAFRQLSEGEQRMLLVARAMVKEPQLLVLDEPCQGLDARNQGRVLEAIDATGDHLETGMIYVTHDTDELPRSITHVIRLDGGRVVGRCRT